jgi:CBS domain containing-hemolysin-like protein
VEPAIGATDVFLRLGVVLLLVLANGFCVAAEFSLVGARRTRIEALARTGHRRAKFARTAIRRLDRFISATQLGITLASLGLGWVGETTMAALFAGFFTHLPAQWQVIARHGVAGVLAFASITYLHIVMGELAPKALALLKPDTVVLWTAGPILVFSRVAAPFITLLNGSANVLLKTVGLRSPRELERVHRPEEIEMLLTQSQEHGLVAEEPVEMIRGVFALSDTTVAEVMTPRPDIVAIPNDSTIDEAEEMILEEGHSRLPVYEDNIDQITGVVLWRDVWRARRNGGRSLPDLVRDVPFVPETKPVEELLREMQQAHTHLAIVVDEFGGTAGLVTMEDLIEEIVGEINDEHEGGPGPIVEIAPGEIELSGNVSIADLNDRYVLDLPEDDYTTVAGYVLGSLGRIPKVGDEVNFDAGTLRVTAMDGRRIDRLRLMLRRRRTDPSEDDEEEES